MTMAAAAAPWPARADFESFPPPDREKMVPVEGGRIYVRQNGVIRAEKPPILFIHGGPGGTHVHYLTMLPLADERAVLMYDQLDSGLSDHPENPKNWRVERFVDEVDHIRRAFGLERLHVCGHSWGGTVALEYAACQPKGLASAILGSPLVSTRSWLADANKLRDRVKNAGFVAFVDKMEANGATLWRVRAGPEVDRAAAEKLRAGIKDKLKLDGMIVTQ